MQGYVSQGQNLPRVAFPVHFPHRAILKVHNRSGPVLPSTGITMAQANTETLTGDVHNTSLGPDLSEKTKYHHHDNNTLG